MHKTQVCATGALLQDFKAYSGHSCASLGFTHIFDLLNETMVRKFSSLFFRQSNRDNVAQATASHVQAGASHSGASNPGVTANPIRRSDFPRKPIRHAKPSGALLGTLRSLQYNIQPQPPLPAHRARGLGELQECFWMEDSLHRTTSQLDRCSNQLDQIHGSAAEVRRELEGLQVELELLQKKMQLDVEPAKCEEPRIEQPKPESPKLVEPNLVEPKPEDPVPKLPAIAKASSIQQRIQFFSKIANS